MGRKSKRIREIEKLVDPDKRYSISESIEILKKCPPVKFEQTVELAVKLGVDPRKSDQQVRGTVSLPHGTGKTVRVLVFTTGDKVQQALDAGADYAGSDELYEKVKSGWTDFDAVIATPDTMREVGKLGKILGPRGLMPTPKAGTVTPNVAEAVASIKAGQVEYKVDKQGAVNVVSGVLGFDVEKIRENLKTLLSAIAKAKPATAKGQYIQNVTVSSTMGPGLKIDLKEVETL